MITNKTLTFERVRQLLTYDPQSGILVWNARINPSDGWNTKYAGTIAGTKEASGITVRIDRARYRAHRLIWVLMTGYWTTKTIDHVNRDQYDNRWENLREATPAQQCQNRSRTTSLPKGVRRERNRYLAVLGSFDTPEEAHAAWLMSARAIHGDFFSVD
jgi:hypothetical protein